MIFGINHQAIKFHKLYSESFYIKKSATSPAIGCQEKSMLKK